MSAIEFFKNPPVVWFLIGLLFALLELVVPGLLLVFFGIGAWIAALLTLLFDVSIGVQIFTFVLASVLSLVFLRNWFKKKFFQESNIENNSFDDELTGKTALVETTIEKGKPGKVMFNGTLWDASSDSTIDVGTHVEIINKKSITLIVKPINK
jgi:membrane protein implicated in regulation of membrane protease activity